REGGGAGVAQAGVIRECDRPAAGLFVVVLEADGGAGGGDRERRIRRADAGEVLLGAAARGGGGRDHGVAAAGRVVAEGVLQGRGQVAGCFSRRRRRRSCELVPYTTLFRSREGGGAGVAQAGVIRECDRPAAGLLVVVLEADGGAGGRD